MNPTRQQMDSILYIMEDEYSKCSTDITGFDEFTNFMKCIRNLDYTSSPGIPFMFERTTIGDWLGFDGIDYNPVQIQILWAMVQDLIRDPSPYILWRVFIKQEPHKLAKADSKRWRLIMCPPLHVQVLWQMLFAKQNAKEITESFSIPSQQGMILCGGQWKHYKRQWELKRTTYGSDKSAWDWTVKGWMFKLDLEFRIRMLRGHGIEKWTTLALKLYEDAFKNTNLVLSSGIIYKQQEWGVMKSGCVNTISTNSHCQVMLHILYSLDHDISHHPMVKACGDDTLQAEIHTLDLNGYEKYGCKIKTVSDTLEFMGHEFRTHGPVPMYLGKHVYNILHCNDDILPEMLDAYLRLYANDDYMYNMWLLLAHLLGLSQHIRSRSYYLYWYHNPMAIGSNSVRYGKFG